jgi:hypothetical protein
LSLILLALMFAMALTAWSGAPGRNPVHSNTSGQPDRYGGRFEGLLGAPLMASGVYVLPILLPRIDPRRARYDALAGACAILRTASSGSAWPCMRCSCRGPGAARVTCTSSCPCQWAW